MSKRRRERNRTRDRTAAPGAAARPGRRPIWLAAALLIGATIAAYANSFSGAFVQDDTDAIVRNPHVRALWPLTRAMVAPSNTTVAGRPVASLSLALNEALTPARARGVWEPSPAVPRSADPYDGHVWGYHAFNLAVHALAALALVGVVRRTLLTPALAPRFGAGALPLAFVIALVWAVHPLHTGSVTYIVQRVESMMGLFYLTTIYAALRAMEQGPQRRLWMAIAIGACALGMGTKEAMISAPIVVWLWLVVCYGPEGKRPPSSLIGALAATWLVLAACVSLAHRSESVGFGLGGWTWWSYLRTQAEVIVHYVRLAFVPSPLVFNYGWLPADSWRQVAPELALVAAAFVATVVGLVRRHPAALAGAVFFLVLAPSSSVLPIVTEVAAEHRMYLPLAAVVALVVLGVYRVARHLAGPALRRAQGTVSLSNGEGPADVRLGPAYVLTTLGAIAVLVVVTVFVQMTRARNEVYVSEAALAADTVRHRPQNAWARAAHGVDLLRARRFAEAEVELRAAVSLPLPPGTTAATRSHMHMYLGSSLCALGRFGEGIAQLNRALELNPTLTEVYALLGEAYLTTGRPREAAVNLERAIAGTPDVPPLHSRLAWLLATSADDGVRDGSKAARHAERAVRLTGGQDAIALDTLAAAYAEAGRYPDAVSTIDAALVVARASGLTGFIPDLERHAAPFRAGKPVRQ